MKMSTVAGPELRPTSRAAQPEPTLRIRPRRGWRNLDVIELWQYRDLLLMLAQRDIQVRYKQAVLGSAWALLQPLVAMVIFSVFLGRMVGVKSDGFPYPVFAYAGLLPWQLFSQGLLQSSNSLIDNERLISKVYFPRLLIPLAAVLVGLVDYMMSCVVFLGLMLFYHVPFTPTLLLMPVLGIFVVMTALSAGVWLSALNAHYRDFRYALPFLVQIWFYVSPVVYPVSYVPEKYRFFYALNPMAGLIEVFRWALLGAAQPSWTMLLGSFLAALALLIGGILYFRTMERTMADWV